jgi:hypothetical protein
MVAWCAECQAEVEVILSEDTSLVQFLGGLRGDSLHVCPPLGSSTQICLPSLLQVSQPSQVPQLDIPNES